MSVPISEISCLSPYLGAPGQPRPSVRRLGRSGGSTVRSSRFRVCPHVLATMRPFGHHHWTLRVERFTLNVPDRYIGHRSVPISEISCLSPYLGAPGQPRPPDRRLGRSGGSTVRSSRFRVCPHVLATMRPFGHHHCTLRVERFTLNVPDRHIGHRVCPHIWAPQPAGTTRPALAQVHRVKSPVAQIACLSPFPATMRPFGRPIES